jgi:hypothetical protein
LDRVRDPSQAGLVYMEQGRIRMRLAAHLTKALRPEHPQAGWFATPDPECSWTTNPSWFGHQRLELRNDLIAATFWSTMRLRAPRSSANKPGPRPIMAASVGSSPVLPDSVVVDPAVTSENRARASCNNASGSSAFLQHSLLVPYSKKDL